MKRIRGFQSKKAVFSVVLFTILIICHFSVFALTQSEEAHNAHTSNGTAFIGKLLNFIILFGGLTFLLRKPVTRFLANRSEEISQSLSEAASSQKEAEKELKKAKNRLKKMSREIGTIKKEGSEQGKRLKEEIAQISLREKEKLIKLTKQEIDQHTKKEVEELRKYMAELTTSLARERIMGKINEEDQADFIDRSIEKLGALYATTRSD